MGRKAKEPIPSEDFADFLTRESAKTGIDKNELVDQIFGDAFITVQEINTTVQESVNSPAGQSPSLTAWKIPESTDSTDELRRLRKEFAPVSKAVDYVKAMILGNELDVLIDDPKDNGKKEIKEEIKNFMDVLYQDDYTTSLYTLMGMMLDEALTVGTSAAEIRYEVPVKFNTYVTNSYKVPKTAVSNEYFYFDTKEPVWADLKNIVQLKILKNGIQRLKPYRDPETWQVNYWTLDERQPSGDDAINNQTTNLVRFHPWQVFWMSINRREFDLTGMSIIEPVKRTALILEQIMQSTGEGIKRAGNKKYLIVCGTPERPWSKPMVRNVMQEFQEMGKRNWTMVPMPAGVDIKEIGGQVFEATNVINTLLVLIAQGMHVPMDVLGTTKSAGNEGNTHQLMTSFNEIEQMRYEFRRCVQSQLFRRQLWIKFGKTRTKQGGKATEAIYVPKLKISTKGLLSPIERLEQIKALLNVANPVIPQLKLNLEKDLAEVLGYDDIDFQTQEELAKQLKEQEELENQQADIEMEHSKMDLKLKKKNLEAPIQAATPFGKKPAGGKPAAKKPAPSSPLGKSQGAKVAPSREKQLKRLANGVSNKKQGSKVGQSKPMGSTRKPNDGKKKVHEVTTDPVEESFGLLDDVIKTIVPTETDTSTVDESEAPEETEETEEIIEEQSEEFEEKAEE